MPPNAAKQVPAVPALDEMGSSLDTDKKRSLLAWSPSVVWGLIILFFSVAPLELKTPIGAGYLDKIAHFTLYLILAFLFAWGLRFSGKAPSVKNIVFALILTIGYGILIEILQSFIPERDACARDALSNAGGVLIGTYLGRLVLWRR